MRTHRGAALFGLFVFACGCGASTSKSGGFDSYVNEGIGLSMKVPSDWGRSKAWSGIGKTGFVTGFVSPDKDATVTVASAVFAGIDCGASAAEAVKDSTGAAMATIVEFEAAAVPHGIPAGQGATAVGDRQGETRYFCHDKTTVVVEASAPRAVYPNNRAQLLGILDSVSYLNPSGAKFALRAPEAPRRATVFLHVVRNKGETLASVVEWYTGSIDNWRAVSRATGGDLSVPSAPLPVGSEIKIPFELLKRQDSMPRSKAKAAPPRPPREPKAVKKAPSKGPAEAKPPVADSDDSDDDKPGNAEKPDKQDKPNKQDEPEEETPLPPVIGPR